MYVCSTPNNGHSEAHAGLPLLTPSRHSGDEGYGHQAYRNSVVRETPFWVRKPQFRGCLGTTGCMILDKILPVVELEAQLKK